MTEGTKGSSSGDVVAGVGDEPQRGATAVGRVLCGLSAAPAPARCSQRGLGAVLGALQACRAPAHACPC